MTLEIKNDTNDTPDVMPAVQATPAAAEAINGLLEQQQLPNHYLRMFIAGSSCSGLQYGMAFEENQREDDTVIESSGVRLIIDSQSLQYLNGSVVDYVETPDGGGFSITNPNSVSSCGTDSGGGCSSCG
jgi:iron-sulfur cluster assembly accessory protein